MNTAPIVSRVWSFCTTLRDDGVGYGDYLEQLTYLIFLKVADEYARPPYGRDVDIPEDYGWTSLTTQRGAELETHYVALLHRLGQQRGMLGQIFTKAQNKITDPAKLFRLIGSRFETDDDRTWFLVRLPTHGEFSRSEEWGGAEQHAGQDAAQDKLLRREERESPTEQDTEQVTEQVGLLVLALTGEMRRLELQNLLRIAHRPHFLETYLNPALKAGLIEMTLPDKPTSRNQRYRRTSAGEALARQLTESSK